MSVFAVVRDIESLHCACDAISELLGAQSPDTTFLGIWVESGGAADVSSLLMEQQLFSPGVLGEDILATCGISGRWTLCWLSRKCERIDLVQALLKVHPISAEPRPPTSCFIPVFDCAMPQSEVQAEVGRLRTIHGANVLPASYQERPSGRLCLAPVYGRGPGAIQ